MRVVVDDEDAPAGQLDRDDLGRRQVGQLGRLPEPDRQVERGPGAGQPAALRLERAAHQLGEPAADREPETGPAEPARDRRVGLAEALEQPRHLLGGDPDAGVADVDPDAPTASERRTPDAGDGQDDLARAR